MVSLGIFLLSISSWNSILVNSQVLSLKLCGFKQWGSYGLQIGGARPTLGPIFGGAKATFGPLLLIISPIFGGATAPLAPLAPPITTSLFVIVLKSIKKD